MEHTKNEWKRYNYLSSEISALYHEAAVKLGLSDSAMNILYAVCENEGRCPQSEVCRLTGVSRQTINSAIRKLEREGVIGELYPFFGATCGVGTNVASGQEMGAKWAKMLRDAGVTAAILTST